MPYRLAFLSADEAYEHWTSIRPLLYRAVECADGDFDLTDVLDKINAEKMRVAVMLKGDLIVLAIVIEVMHYPRKSALNITLMGGRDSRVFFRDFFHHLKDYARDIGCTQIQAGCGEAQARLFNHLAGSHDVYRVIRVNA